MVQLVLESHAALTGLVGLKWHSVWATPLGLGARSVPPLWVATLTAMGAESPMADSRPTVRPKRRERPTLAIDAHRSRHDWT
jgi:hypothetical protein